MTRNLLLSVIIAGFLCAGCSSSKKSTGVWVNKDKIQGKSFHKLFIVVMSANAESRARLENDLATAAISRGYEAVKSVSVLPTNLDNPKAPSKEEIISNVKSCGCDGVFIASLLKQEEGVRYKSSRTSYTVTPYYSYYGSYPGYYSHYSPTVYTPSYYDVQKGYFIQSNLYDAASQEIMWSVQSEVFNPSSLQRFSESYTASLLKLLEKEKLMKK